MVPALKSRKKKRGLGGGRGSRTPQFCDGPGRPFLVRVWIAPEGAGGRGSTQAGRLGAGLAKGPATGPQSVKLTLPFLANDTLNT